MNRFLKIEVSEIKIGDSYDVYLAFGDIIHLEYLDKPLFLGFLKDEIKDDANTHLRLAWRMTKRKEARLYIYWFEKNFHLLKHRIVILYLYSTD